MGNDNSKTLVLPKIYCINLASSTSRHERMMNRFRAHGLSHKVTFVKAIPYQSALIDYYGEGVQPWYSSVDQWRKDLACYASHLKAIRTSLEDSIDEEGALICEDDILLHNNFIERYGQIMNNVPSGTGLVSMSYMIEDWNNGFTSAGVNPILGNLYTFNKKVTWGTQLYWISREYGLKVLNDFDKPLRYLENYFPLTSEIIVKESKGYLAYPPLAIEDGLDSDRAPADLPYHHKHFSRWGYHNYSKTETVISPLAK